MALAQKTFEELITFTRASVANTVDSNGNLVEVLADVPRLTFSNDGSENLGILIEPARTNKVLYSCVPNQGTYAQSGSCTLTPEVGTFLGIFTDAIRIASDGGTDADHLRALSENALPIGTQRVFSAYVKAGTSGSVAITIYSDTDATQAVKSFTLNNLSDASVGKLISGVNFEIYWKIDCLGNDFYKIEMGMELIAGSASQNLVFDLSPNAALVGEDVVLLGWQIEDGLGATSIIKTTSSQATRLKDLALLSSLNPWINQKSGTLLCKFVKSSYVSKNKFLSLFSFDNGVFGDRLDMSIDDSGRAVFAHNFGGALDNQTEVCPAATFPNESIIAVALSYDRVTKTLKSVFNGGTPVSVIFTDNLIDLLIMQIGGQSDTEDVLGGTIRSIKYYPYVMSNGDAIAATTI